MKKLATSKYSEFTEIELIEKAKSNSRYFEPLYVKYYEQIFRLIFTRIQDEELAADITANAFTKAIGNLNKYKHQGFPFSAWLARIALNSCYDYFRAQKKQRYVALENYVSHDLAFEIELEENQKELWLAHLPTALEALKPRDLELIELRFFEGKSFAEIGYLLDITEGNAKTKTYRLLKRLKKSFRREVS
jgi:RNA polymerase sigma-70 factor (ECF subfamily)